MTGTAMHHQLGRPFWEPGTRVRIRHTRTAGTVVTNTTEAMANTMTAHGFVAAGPGRWRLPDSSHRPVDDTAIDDLVTQLRHRHRVAVSIRLAAPAAAVTTN